MICDNGDLGPEHQVAYAYLFTRSRLILAWLSI